MSDGEQIQPRIKETLSMFYRRMVSKFPKYLRTDDDHLYCVVCDKQLHTKKLFGVKQHFGGAAHIAMLRESGLAEVKEEIKFEGTTKPYVESSYVESSIYSTY